MIPKPLLRRAAPGRGGRRRFRASPIGPRGGVTSEAASHRQRFIVLIGTARGAGGGIAAVISAYEQAGLFARFPIKHVATHSEGSALRKFRQAMFAFGVFVRLVVTRRVALVHAHSASNASFWRKCIFMSTALLAGIPVIFHLHGGGFMDFYGRQCGPVRRWIVRAVLDHVTAIAVVSEEWRRAVSQISANRNISVIPNPVAGQSLLTLPLDKRRHDVVLFLGRLERDKGVFHLVDAIEAVRKRHADVKLWFAGEGDRQGLMSRIGARGLGDAVQFFGWVTGEAKGRLLGEAAVYVLPSHLEGLPMALLEAMAAGLPVVATRVGGIPSLVEDGVNGLLVEPGDVGKLANAIDLLLSDPGLRQRMGEASRQKIHAHYLPERVLEQIDALYRKCLVPSQGTPSPEPPP